MERTKSKEKHKILTLLMDSAVQRYLSYTNHIGDSMVKNIQHCTVLAKINILSICQYNIQPKPYIFTYCLYTNRLLCVTNIYKNVHFVCKWVTSDQHNIYMRHSRSSLSLYFHRHICAPNVRFPFYAPSRWAIHIPELCFG